jgi:hypothetical protein
MLRECEMLTFDMYFCSVCSMQYHPGAGTKEHKALSIDECKDVALEMIKARRGIVIHES